MAKDNSFDIVSEIDMQEVDNAINQAQREVGTRYDFKGSSAGVEFNRKDETLTFTADQDQQLKAVRQVVTEKLIKRGIEPSALDLQNPEDASGGTLRQVAKLRSGIDKDTAKQITKRIKELQKDQKLKVNAQIEGDTVRVKGPKRDDLQAVMKDLKENGPEIPLQFTNYR
ncbi:MAG: YajQ family cyclic di-GMP-binding protein [Planctomycetota bacterium]